MGKSHSSGRKDANHDFIVGAFEALCCSVLECHRVSIRGFPDLIVGYLGYNHLVEIKNQEGHYGRRGLNANQIVFSQKWRGGPVEIVRTMDDVVSLVAKWRKGSRDFGVAA